ncbi:MAG: hypothetical protein AAFV53_11275 [Myxococcota bacterium]
MPGRRAEAGFEARLTNLLRELNRQGSYRLSLLCTEQGLLLGSAGALEQCEQAAGLTSLFDDIVVRAVRDLSVSRVDELTLVDDAGIRYIIRPLPLSTLRVFLVVAAPRNATWRRNTNQLVRDLQPLLEPFAASVSGAALEEVTDAA